jgi:sRNA-binding regulator protein Hfq
MKTSVVRSASVARDEAAQVSAPTAVLEAPVLAENRSNSAPPAVRRKPNTLPAAPSGRHFAVLPPDEHAGNRQAETFYLQKQVQLQTQMVLILEDGTRLQGVIEWYDRNSMKIRGRSRVLVYKSAIKYLYKAGEVGAPE